MHAGAPPPLELKLPAEPTSVSKARRVLEKFAKDCGAEVDAIKLAVSEATSNVVQHAYRSGRSGAIWIRAALSGRHLEVEVRDEGVGLTPNPGSQGMGMGLSLIGTVADHVELDNSEQGLRVAMRFPCF